MSQTTEPASPEDAGPVAELPEPRTEESLRDPQLATLASDALLEELLRRLRDVLGADSATVLTVDPARAVVQPILSLGVPLAALADLAVPVGAGFAGRIAATAAPLRLDDVDQAPDLVSPAFPAAGIRSLLGAPLVVEGRVVGVIHVGSRRPARFGPDEERLLRAAADRAAWAIDHGLLLAAEQRARRTAAGVAERLARLRAVSHELLSDLTVEDVVRTLVERGLSLIGAFGGSVWELDEQAQALRLRGAVGYPADVVERWAAIPLDAPGPGPDAVRTGQTVVIRSVQERDERYPELAGSGSAGAAFVVAPLVVDGRAIGALGLGFTRADDLDDEGLLFIDAATAQCAAAMHRALIGEIQQRSLADARELARRLAALQRLTAALADKRDAGVMVDLIIDEVAAALGGEQVAVCLVDPSGERLEAFRFHGLTDELSSEFAEFPLAPGLPAADAVLTGRPVVFRDKAERDAAYPHLSRHPLTNAWACLPLTVGERRIGALALALPQPQEFRSGDLEFLMAVADQCAHALERARLLANEQATRDRLELLAEVGRIFTAPLDVELTSRQFCQLVVGRIGDTISVHLRDPDGGYSLAAVENVDPAQGELHRALAARVPAAFRSAFDAVLAAGRPVVVPDIDVAALLADVEDADVRAALVEQPPHSGIVLPLLAGGHALGVLVVSAVGDRPPLTDVERGQLEELAGRLALAIDSARLLRQQIEIAHTLQRSLLPAVLPQVPGAEVAVRYLPGAEGVDVGGDFYDVMLLPSGRIGLVVGDVMGRGVRAAAVMGQLRAAVRSYSLEGHPPAALLTRLDRLVGTLEEGLLVTAFYAEWDPVAGTAVCSCAGHLPPLLRRPGEEPGYLEIDPGVPLGVGAQPYREIEIELPPGSLLLAYTDGLVEGPDLPVDDGMSQLAAAVRDAQGALGVCDAALDALRPIRATRTYDDDTALLALVTLDRVEAGAPAGPSDATTVDLPADYGSPARARSLVADQLARWQLPGLVDVATLLVSELVTNAVRHAGTGLRVTVTRLAPERVRIAVSDHAPGVQVQVRASGSEAEGGRGLFLVEHLSAGWGAVADETSKTVWFELNG